jgi:hypothetical protein
LQDAGLSCFEYVEQLTLLLFLKMADQLTEPPYNRPSAIPHDLSWKALLPFDGAALEDKYRETLELVINEDYTRRVRELQTHVCKTMQDLGNPFLRSLQILACLRKLPEDLN